MGCSGSKETDTPPVGKTSVVSQCFLKDWEGIIWRRRRYLFTHGDFHVSWSDWVLVLYIFFPSWFFSKSVMKKCILRYWTRKIHLFLLLPIDCILRTSIRRCLRKLTFISAAVLNLRRPLPYLSWTMFCFVPEVLAYASFSFFLKKINWSVNFWILGARTKTVRTIFSLILTLFNLENTLKDFIHKKTNHILFGIWVVKPFVRTYVCMKCIYCAVIPYKDTLIDYIFKFL